MSKSLTSLASVSFIGRVIGKAFTYGLMLVVANQLGASALGTFAIGLVILRIGSTISRFGMDVVAQKYIPKYENEHIGLLSGTVVVSLGTPFILGSLLAFLIIFQFDHLSHFAFEPLSPSIKFLAVGIPLFGVMTVAARATRGFRETKYSVFIEDIVFSGGAFICTILVLSISNSIQFVILSYIFAILCGAVTGIVLLNHLGAFEGLASFSVNPRDIFSFAGNTALTSVGQRLLMWTDVVILTAFVGSAAIGKYEAAFQISALLAFALTSVNSIFPAIASNLYHESRLTKLDTLYKALTKWIFYLTAIGAMFVVLFSVPILSLFGSEFTSAKVPLTLLIGMRLIVAAVGPSGFLLIMSSNERIELGNTIFGVLLNVILNILLIGTLNMGILGAAIATSTTMAFVNVVRVIELYYLLGVQPYSIDYIRGLPILIVIGLLHYYGSKLNIDPRIKIAIFSTLSLVIFLILARTFLYTSKDDVLLGAIN